MNTCKHAVEPFFNDNFTKPKEPTEYQIAKYKLYQCGECHRWFSFFGTIEIGIIGGKSDK